MEKRRQAERNYRRLRTLTWSRARTQPKIDTAKPSSLWSLFCSQSVSAQFNVSIKSHIPLGSLANHQTPPVSHHSDHDLSFSLAMGPSGIRGGPNDLIFDASFIGAANNAEKALLSPVPRYSKQGGRCLRFIFVIEEKGILILAFLPTYSSHARLQTAHMFNIQYLMFWCHCQQDYYK